MKIFIHQENNNNINVTIGRLLQAGKATNKRENKK